MIRGPERAVTSADGGPLRRPSAREGVDGPESASAKASAGTATRNRTPAFVSRSSSWGSAQDP